MNEANEVQSQLDAILTGAALNRFNGHADGSFTWRAPKPLGATLPLVEPFIPELLPPSICDYVIDCSDRQQAPPDFAAVAAVCGLAALAGNTVRIRPKANDDWLVVPNLWGATIGRPSSMKSPSLRAALAPVFAMQDEMRETWEAASGGGGVDDAIAKIGAKDAQKRAAKAYKDGNEETRGISSRLQ